MTATTPSGTRTRVILRPLGRVKPSVTSPTGSGKPATWRRPDRHPRDSLLGEAEAVEQSAGNPLGFGLGKVGPIGLDQFGAASSRPPSGRQQGPVLVGGGGTGEFERRRLGPGADLIDRRCSTRCAQTWRGHRGSLRRTNILPHVVDESAVRPGERPDLCKPVDQI